MSAVPSLSPEEQAVRYETYVRENWDRMSSFEQDQARSYFQAKQQAAMQPNLYALNNAAGYGGYKQPYFGGVFASVPAPVEKSGFSWAILLGYIGCLFFPLLGLICGFFLIFKGGRPVHGLIQVVLSVGSMILGAMIMASM